jgi:glycosyltransferase involved in cell wall biosynthesis
MKVLHINNFDLIGARFNGYCMMDENTNSDFEFSMAVWNKQSNNNKVYLLPPQNSFAKFLVEKIIHFTAKLGFDHFFSFFSYYLLSKQKYFREADIVHLHIIHGDTNISFKDLPQFCRNKKIVWTLHDQWATSGGCIHPFDCDGTIRSCYKYCPLPRYNSAFKHIMPFFLFKLKKHYYAKSDFDIVVSTEWMRDKISNSSLLHSSRISVISFGVNLQVFKNQGKNEVRTLLGIPLNHFVLILRNTGIETDAVKGLKYAKEALLDLISDVPITVIILEKINGFESLSNKFNIITTSWLNQNELIKYLSSADALLMPSLQESFGLMAVESMACSVPVVVAEGTALPEVVGNNVGGIVVKQRNSDEIVKAIQLLINDKEYYAKLCKSARERVELKYDIRKYIEAHERLYSSMIHNNQKL